MDRSSWETGEEMLDVAGSWGDGEGRNVVGLLRLVGEETVDAALDCFLTAGGGGAALCGGALEGVRR